MPPLPWFRVYAEAVDDDKLRLLAFEDRWHYVALLCCKAQGILDTHKATLDRRVAAKLGLRDTELSEVRRRLVEVGLINSHWQPLQWDNRQYRSDSSKERTRKWRERHKKRHGDVTVTAQESESESELETKPNRQLHETVVVGGKHDENCDGKNELNNGKKVQVPYRDIVALYHEHLPSLPRCKVLTKARKQSIRQRWIEGQLPDLDTWEKYFAFCARSRFLSGDGSTRRETGHVFRPDIGWLTKIGNYAKICERQYHDD